MAAARAPRIVVAVGLAAPTTDPPHRVGGVWSFVDIGIGDRVMSDY